MASMAVARGFHCTLQRVPRVGSTATGGETSVGGPDQVKVILQPRLCTLRSYASDRGGVIRTSTTSSMKSSSSSTNSKREMIGNGNIEVQELELSPFLENLYEYIESTKKSHDFEIITGRLAMMIFAATVGVELTTGNSVFKKMDIQGLTEALGGCLASVICAATFAYSSSARKKVGRIFTVSCNAFIDALIDNIVDGLFYESDHEVESSNNNKDL